MITSAEIRFLIAWPLVYFQNSIRSSALCRSLNVFSARLSIVTCSRPVISSSLCPPRCLSLLLFLRPPSDRSWQLPSDLFQALAHTQSRSLVSSHTLFVTFSCYSSILLFDSIWMYLPDRVCVCVCPTWIGFWGLAPTTQNLQEDKSKKGIRPLLLPVSSCPSGKSGDGGSVLSLFASLSVGFLSHILYSLVITSQAWLSFLVSQSYCFWPVSICFLPFCSVEKKLHLSVCLFILHQKWPWWFCPSGQPFCLLAQVSFYSLFHS